MSDADASTGAASASAPQASEGRSFEEHIHWSDGFKLRSMTGTFLVLIIWVAAWGYLFLSWAPVELKPEFQPDGPGGGPAPITDKTADTTPKLKSTKTGTVKHVIIPDVSPLFWFVWKTEKVLIPVDAVDENGKITVSLDEISAVGTDATEENAVEEDEGDYFTFSRPSYKRSETGDFLAELEGNTRMLSPSYINLYAWLAIAGIPFLWIVWRALYKKLSLSYTLTDHRIIVREGLLSRHEHQIRLILVDDLAVHRSLFNRIFGVGTIYVHAAADKDYPEFNIEGITDPVKVKEQIYKIAEEKRADKEFIGGAAVHSTG